MTDEKEIDRITLSDGKTVIFDLYQMSRKQFAELSSGKMEDDEARKLLSGVCGVEPDYLDSIPYPDWRRLLAAFNLYVLAPVDAYPNSRSGSTSE